MAQSIPNTTTANVRAETARRGLSPAGLASRTGIPSSRMYRRLESGAWTIEELEAIADALNVPLNRLLKAAR